MINVIVFIGTLILYGVIHCSNFCGVIADCHTTCSQCSQGLTLFSIFNMMSQGSRNDV